MYETKSGDITKLEYRVRETRRFIVTRYEEFTNADGITGHGGVQEIGEYPSGETAYAVGYALCKQEHAKLDWPLDDERITYPRDPNEVDVLEASE